MADESLDNLDREILHLLQVNARGLSDTEIAAETDVTSTTVANRIKRLEEKGIIRGYHPDIDYEQAGYPLIVLFICIVPVAERPEVVDQVLDVRGVVNVKEMVTGEQNLHIQAVADSTDRIEVLAGELNDLGIQISSSHIVSHETVQPWNHFHLEAYEQAPRAREDDPTE